MLNLNDSYHKSKADFSGARIYIALQHQSEITKDDHEHRNQLLSGRHCAGNHHHSLPGKCAPGCPGIAQGIGRGTAGPARRDRAGPHRTDAHRTVVSRERAEPVAGIDRDRVSRRIRYGTLPDSHPGGRRDVGRSCRSNQRIIKNAL
jgi:hypothetical protein